MRQQGLARAVGQPANRAKNDQEEAKEQIEYTPLISLLYRIKYLLGLKRYSGKQMMKKYYKYIN